MYGNINCKESDEITGLGTRGSGMSSIRHDGTSCAYFFSIGQIILV